MEEQKKKLSEVARKLTPSPIQELSHLAERSGAINLAEGFPDFAAPPAIKLAAVSAINSDLNQYRHVQEICELLAVKMQQTHGLDVDPLTDFAICCGQSEAFAATVFAIINRGDEVLLFDPAYETYESCIRLAGGVPVFVALDPPHWSLNRDKFLKSFTKQTKAVVLNSPHNPTGKVFTMEELQVIAGACCNMDCFAITDEVYEYITYDTHKHTSLASIPGMQQRTIITSSLSKTFSVTGWRIGWACAPADIALAIRNIHIKITDSAPAPFQEAALTALKSPPAYFSSLRTKYQAKRDCMIEMLSVLGFQIKCKPQGAVFVFAELPENWAHSDMYCTHLEIYDECCGICCIARSSDFVRTLIQKAGVAAVPGCGFFHANPNNGENFHNRFIRFAFCKSEATLTAAAKKIREFMNSHG